MSGASETAYQAVHKLQCDGKATAVRDLVDSEHDRLYELLAALRGVEALLTMGESEESWERVSHGQTTLLRALEDLDQIRDRLDPVRVLRALSEDARDLQGVALP